MTKYLPVSGYTILAVYSTHQRLKAVASDSLPQDDAISISWDWRWIERRVVEVRVGVTVAASKARPWLISADVVGRFRQVADSPSLDIQEFVSLQAVAVLLPYVRQYLSSLSSNTLSGTYYLPSLNVTELRKDFNFPESTGAKQDVAMLGGQSTAKAATAKKRKRTPA